LNHTAVTDAGVQDLAKLKSLKYLVVALSKMSEAGAAELRQALPDCEIVSRVQESHP
jgi:hypothetical protein